MEISDASKPLDRPAGALPPGPRGLPYFGRLHGLLRNPMRFWSDIANRYGGIARVRLKGKYVYLISHPDLLYELLITNRHKYRKNTRYKAAVDTFGEGLLLTEGDAWRRLRRITQPTFKTDYIGTQIPSMASLTERFFARWEAIADADGISDIHEDFMRLAQLQAGHYLMGPGFDRIEERFFAAAVAIKDNWPLPPRNLFALFLPPNRQRESRLEEAIRSIDACIDEYLAQQREADFDNCGVLTALVHTSRAQGEQFSDRSLRDQLLTLFFAGHETSASSLSWIHYLLAEHPEARARLHREVDAVLGASLTPSAAQLDQLVFMEQVINESLRLYSPIHSISRVALDDDIVGGFSIPKGAMIYVSLYATHRLPSIWKNPDQFEPARFEPARASKLPRFAFIPFAAGHRNCIGASMAMAELKTILAQTTQRFEFSVAPGHRVEMRAGTTMYPRYGMRMKIRRRGAPVRSRSIAVDR